MTTQLVSEIPAAGNLNPFFGILFTFFFNINTFPFHSLINYLQMTQFCIWFSSLWLSTNSEWIINDVCCSEQTIKFSRISKPNGISSPTRRLCSSTAASLGFFFFSFCFFCFLCERRETSQSIEASVSFHFFFFWRLNSASLSLQVWLMLCCINVSKLLVVQENSASFTALWVKQDQRMNIDMS